MITGATEMSAFARSVYMQKYSMDGRETWEDTAHRVASSVMGAIELPYRNVERLIAERKFIPGGRYLYASGRGLHQVNNCCLYRADDSREGWAELMRKAGMALMTGAGIGVDYSEVRPKGSIISKTGGLASGPCELMEIINEIGRHVMQGGSRRSAIWAGLSWKHADIMDFIQLKNWSPEVRALKESNFNFPATMDMTNVSVILDDDFFHAYENEWDALHARAHDVYWAALRRMVKTAEPGFSVDVGENEGETLRNACTEVSSRDDSDVCNLGSINLARIESKDELVECVYYATEFLMAGTVYSDVPHEEIRVTREKNRRLGLGLMGVHEWLAMRGLPYAPNDELAGYLGIYAESAIAAHHIADKWGVSRPVKTRAIAPTGTIGIVGETTTGIEPIFCVAYKRRYLAGGKEWKYQFVVDPTAKRVVEQGIDPDSIEDAYGLAMDVERRVGMQAWVQAYVDHGISSTVNLPAPLEGQDAVAFGTMLMRYLPHLRGITAYPDGSRSGQPITKLPLATALQYEGVVFETEEESCVGGVCGI